MMAWDQTTLWPEAGSPVRPRLTRRRHSIRRKFDESRQLVLLLVNRMDPDPALPEHSGPLLLTVDGQTKTVMQWAVERGLEVSTVYARLRRGWSPAAAVSTFKPMPLACTPAAVGIPAGHPGALSWDQLEWDEDDHAWYATEHHPAGLEIEQIAELIGSERSSVHDVITNALAKCKCAFAIEDAVGVERADWLLRSLRGHPLDAYERVAARVAERAGRGQLQRVPRRKLTEEVEGEGD